ncbi:ispE: 4-(cytidine 5'-diphospho)-2-C-methyl-D-erythritol kinase [Rubrobacter radiotolerans]|uniref:4-diphosphocytidyl-2-C-methyl-D-erythritol kinase n=1 Tax=Rubrobacter radiotolerans TaxID=42256 RepID=A0A023X199_RUBRA|nr:4-(cytidine 5'-diphospho)-2-C-methyl-D-erythritol kinase [Rubrobacter radiotolerans]AHY46068.1 ispE: 4-(cytidine 5'-diphospho)-2-C-methyl-D-erythritol kinase [Rubrobacter radiotolerans]MDX5893478.1 4-(cytidine 5'-diphospho)-2-C-methyl-D-erythritol kinase [Rubrobacter radiotolerans]SMC03814.1 4-diphosphocytidyl-2-C-methyl-D-erythritol kinase [Rubrobacter radiotolerans DSM 5868]
MKRIRLRAHAKVNYSLEVTGVRDDGYHTLRTVFQSISLADELSFERAEGRGEGFALEVEPPKAPLGPPGENTVRRAWELVCERAGRTLPVRVSLLKRVPAGAGLGGGSADGAATLVGLSELYGLGLSEEELLGIAARVGADVPFCLLGGTRLGEGVGERLTPLPPPPEHYIAVAKPEASASTAEIFRIYDRRSVERKGNSRPVMAAIRAGSLTRLASSVGNDLAPLTAALVPEVLDYERALLEAGALGTAMTGSGTAVYGIFADERRARAALLGEKLAGAAVGVFRPARSGVEPL